MWQDLLSHSSPCAHTQASTIGKCCSASLKLIRTSGVWKNICSAPLSSTAEVHCALLSTYGLLLFGMGQLEAIPGVSRSSPQRDWELSWGCPCLAEPFCSSMSQPGTHSHIALLHMPGAPLGNSLCFPSWIVSNQRSRGSRGRESVRGHCGFSVSLRCTSELHAGVRWTGVFSYQIHNRRNTLHILQDSEKDRYNAPFHYGCFPPLWFEFCVFTSCNSLLEKLQNVQCPLYQSVHLSEGGSRQIFEREYRCHIAITLSPGSNKAAFGAPLLPCPSGWNVSNTSQGKCYMQTIIKAHGLYYTSDSSYMC